MKSIDTLHTGFLPADIPDNAPWAEAAYLVGGCVRDRLLERAPKDYDIAVFPPVRPFAENLSRATGGHCVDIGKPGRQIIRVVAGSTLLDVSPINGPSIESDLRRRDFTINALAYHLGGRQIIDCTGGIDDLQQRRLRMVSSRIFADDPVRMVRAYRLGATLGFRIDPGTAAAIKAHAPLIQTTAGERIHMEILQLFSAENSLPWVAQMTRDTLIFSIFPELLPLRGCRQNRHHDFDAWDHTLETFKHMERVIRRRGAMLPQAQDELNACLTDDTPALLKLAALLHDIGKPPCRKISGKGEASFYGHPRKGAEMAEKIAARLRFSAWESRVVTGVVRNHLLPLLLHIDQRSTGPSPKAPTRFFMKCGRLSPLILLHSLADHLGKHRLEPLGDDDFTRFVKEMLTYYLTEFQRKTTQRPLVTGHDLITEFGLAPGPEFKSILEHVETARLSGEAATRAQGLETAAAYMQERGIRPGRK